MDRHTPLNGTKTHPLTQHAYAALEKLLKGPLPRQDFNAGVSNRLEREDLVEVIMEANPYPTSQKRFPKIEHLKITEAGRAALQNRP